MILLVIIAVGVLFLIVRRVKRKNAIADMQIRPYRYPVETRRSRFGTRGGF